jgi:hypothetical protein
LLAALPGPADELDVFQLAGELVQVGAFVVEDVEAVDAYPAVVAHPVGEELGSVFYHGDCAQVILGNYYYYLAIDELSMVSECEIAVDGTAIDNPLDTDIGSSSLQRSS